MYRLKELMKMFDIPERTIRRHLKTGLLRGTKLGGLWIFSDEDVKNYLNLSSVKQAVRRNFNSKVQAYLNGFSQIKNSTLISFNLPELSKNQLYELTDFVNAFSEEFSLNVQSSSHVSNISFIGHRRDTFKLIEYMEKYYE